METYDLTYFKFLGGLVAGDGKDNGWENDSHESGSSTEYGLAPPQSKELDEAPANQILFSSIWTSQRRKSSITATAAGKVTDIKGRFEKGKRVVSGVFSALTGNDKSATEKLKDPVKHHEIPHGNSGHNLNKAAERRTSAFGFQGLPKQAASDDMPRRPKAGPPPPQHAMTLAKGWNSGLAPTHSTKPLTAEY